MSHEDEQDVDSEINLQERLIGERGFFSKPGSLVKRFALDVASLGLDERINDELPSYMDIIEGKGHVDVADAKNRIGKAIGVDLEFGPDQDKTTVEYVGNALVNFGLDTALDPFSWIGVGALGRTAKLLNIGKSTVKGAAGRAAVGGAIGAASLIESDDTALDKAKVIATSAALATGLSPKLVSGAKTMGIKYGNSIYDETVKAMHPKVFENTNITPSQVQTAAREFHVKVNPLKASFERAFDDITNSLKTPEQIDAFKTIVGGGFVDAVSHRNKLIGDKGKKISSNDFNAATIQANTAVGMDVNKKLVELNDPVVSKAVEGWRRENHKFVDVFNKKWKGKKPELIGLDFYYTDIAPFTKKIDPLDAIQGPRKISTGLVRRYKEDISQSNLAFGELNNIRADRIAGSFADSREKEALSLIREMRESTSKAEGFTKGFQKALEGWDRFSNFMKSNHLLASASWMQNNLSENLLRAYMVHGVKGVGEALDSLSSINKTGMYKELLEHSNPANAMGKARFGDEFLTLATDAGVIDKNFFKEVDIATQITPEFGIAKYGEERYKQIMEQFESRNLLSRGMDGWTEFLQRSVGRIASASEDTSRATVFKHVMKAEMGKPQNSHLKDVWKKHGARAMSLDSRFADTVNQAKKVVNDTFFDYGNVQPFEQAFMKRIVPYYTFISRDMEFWSKNLLKNTERIAGIARARRSIGRPLSDEEREGMPQWMLDYGARAIDSKGTKVGVLYYPNLAINSYLGLLSGNTQLTEPIHPFIKSAAEQAFDIDLFQDSEFTQGLTPKKRGGRKRLYTSAHILFLESMGFDIRRDKNGKPYTKSQAIARFDNFKRNFLPLPIADQIARTVDVIAQGQETTGQALLNLTPLKQRDIAVSRIKRTAAIRKATRKKRRQEDGR